MELKIPNVTKELIEYSFVFDSGMEVSFLLDESAGDTIADQPDALRISLKDKPNQFNPEEILPGEDVTIVKNTLAVVRKRKIAQRMPSPEELFDLQKILHKPPKKVQ